MGNTVGIITQGIPLEWLAQGSKTGEAIRSLRSGVVDAGATEYHSTVWAWRLASEGGAVTSAPLSELSNQTLKATSCVLIVHVYGAHVSAEARAAAHTPASEELSPLSLRNEIVHAKSVVTPRGFSGHVGGSSSSSSSSSNSSSSSSSDNEGDSDGEHGHTHSLAFRAYVWRGKQAPAELVAEANRLGDAVHSTLEENPDLLPALQHAARCGNRAVGARDVYANDILATSTWDGSCGLIAHIRAMYLQDPPLSLASLAKQTDLAAASPLPKLALPGLGSGGLQIKRLALPARGGRGDGAADQFDLHKVKEDKKAKIEYWDKQCSQITESLFLGSQTVAMDLALLKSVGVTHVVNCAGAVCENYFESEFGYRRLFLTDGETEDISTLLYDVNEWIDHVIVDLHGRVFIHCQQGVSRSSAILIGYLMWKRGESFNAVHQYVRERRGVSRPNAGFMCQLLTMGRRISAGRAAEEFRMYSILPQSRWDLDFLVAKVADKAQFASRPRDSCFLFQSSLGFVVFPGPDCSPLKLAAAQKTIARIVRFESVPEPESSTSILYNAEELPSLIKTFLQV